MYLEKQPMQSVTKEQLPEKVKQYLADGYRLVQIHATTMAQEFEVTYCFDKNYDFAGVRIPVAKSDPVLPSITNAYLCAFTYENEIHDLFGISFTGLALDFKGTFYRKSVATPFAAPSSKSVEK
jgi:ech hydrogenase subunit D